MNPLIIGIAWLVAGAVLGTVLTLLVGPMGARRQRDRARLAMADSQQRRALEKVREDNNELTARLDSQDQRHARAIDALKRQHAEELGALEEALKIERGKLRALVSASAQGHVISGTAFEPTRFDDEV